MTNREWLQTLNSEQFNSWLCDKSTVLRMDGLNKIYDDLYPRLWEIQQITICPKGYLEIWLDKEREENGGKLL